MSDHELLQVDPAALHLPGGRRDEVDPTKLQRQLAQHGMSVSGMSPLGSVAVVMVSWSSTTEWSLTRSLESLNWIGRHFGS
jgi:hypothetical protein